MKYIRTKDGIYEYEKVKTRVFIQEGVHSKEKLLSEEKSLNLFPYEIIKQADTIEELCDEFVMFYDNEETKPDLTYRDGFNDLYFQNELKHSAKCYGAIWTDKGLIYVAKMNEKGELELL